MPTRSRPAAHQGAQVPRVRHAPTVRANAWEDVADLAKAYGLVLDPWQENVLQGAMGERADGQWATPTVGVSVPRQNGKGALIEARELAGLLVFGEKTIIHSAHEQKTARVGFERILSYFENYDDLRKKVKSTMSALGREHIKLRNGCELHFPARSKGAIRGFSIDCLILDEAQILGDPAWEAIKPTISARPNVQTWLLGTPPTPLDDGAVFTRTRARGHEGKDHRIAWFEWSSAPGADLDDREAWRTANPALGIRINYEAVADERAELSPQGFSRERLGMWDEGRKHAVVIPDEVWAGQRSADPPQPDAAPNALALDRWHDGATAVAAAWREDDVTHVEIVAAETVADTSGVVEWLVTTAGRKVPVLIVADSPAAALAAELKAQQVDVRLISAADFARSCEAFRLGVIDGDTWHSEDKGGPIGAALAGAEKQAVGKAGAWVWNRSRPEVNIAPLVAATAARLGAVSIEPKKPSAVFAF